MWGHIPECLSIISLLLVFPYTRATPYTSEVPSRPTLLTALGRALDYMAGNQQQMDINGYLGVAIAQGQLESMKPLNECAVRNPWRKANYLLKIARNTNFPKNIAKGVSLIHTQSVAERVLEAERWRGVGKNFNRTLQCRLEVKNSSGRNAKTYMRNSPNGRESDLCLSQLMKQMEDKVKAADLDVGSSCKLSHLCRWILTSGDSWAYSLTHRIIYNLVSQAMGCNENIPVEEYCCKIMEEVRQVQGAGYPLRWRDLFMEQILVCSLSGFGQFLQNEWLQLVLDWQRNSGCWGSQNMSPNPSKNYQQNSEAVSRKRPPAKLWDSSLKIDELLLRVKRSSGFTVHSDCSTHTNGLGVALLALAARHRQSSETDKTIYC